MKKMIPFCFVLLLTAVILVSCQNEPEQVEPDEETNGQAEENQDDENELDVEKDEQPEEDLSDEVNDPAEEEEEEVEVQYQLNPTNWAVDPLTDEIEEQVVLLTIDDAPEDYALEMAKSLAELDAKAIFFVNGHFLQSDEKQAILREIHELGFSIGNHTYNHPNLSDLTREEQREEIVGLNDLVEEIIGERPVFFRAPFGANPDETHEIVAEEGMVLMNWTYGYDWEADYREKDALADVMVNSPYLRNGANLLMHDREWTAEALPEIVEGLREKGYEIVDPAAIKTPDQS